MGSTAALLRGVGAQGLIEAISDRISWIFHSAQRRGHEFVLDRTAGCIQFLAYP